MHTFATIGARLPIRNAISAAKLAGCQPHTATVRAASTARVYEFEDAASFLAPQPAVAMLVAKTLAQRLYASTSYLADIKRQYA